MYKVIKGFTDLQDNNHVYNVGDDFPRKGAVVTEKRIVQLSSNTNRQRVPLIADKKGNMTNDGLNLTSPAQSEKIEQETPLKEEVAEKPKSNQKKKAK